jgi:hypothetical protein
MFSFIKNNLHIIAEFISLGIAIFNYPYLKKSNMKWVLPFLVFIFSSEVIIDYLYFYNPYRTNTDFYYIVGIGESIFYGQFFYKICQNDSLKKIVFGFGVVPVMLYSCGIFFYTNDYEIYIFCLITSGVSLSLISLAYMYSFYFDDSRNSIVSDDGFWVALGVSLFFSTTSVVFCLHDFIYRNDLNLFGVKLYKIVPRILCIILYSCISIAIILCKKKTKISL